MSAFVFMASEEDATQAVLGLAGDPLDEAAYTVWLRANSNVAETDEIEAPGSPSISVFS